MEVIERPGGSKYSRRSFTKIHYEDMWSPYERCKEIVKHEWVNSCRLNCENLVLLFNKKSKDSMAELKIGNKNEFGGRKKKLDQLLHQLQSIREGRDQYVCGNEIKHIEKQIDDMLLE